MQWLKLMKDKTLQDLRCSENSKDKKNKIKRKNLDTSQLNYRKSKTKCLKQQGGGRKQGKNQNRDKDRVDNVLLVRSYGSQKTMNFVREMNFLNFCLKVNLKFYGK